jgi:Rod binding domain-containing protein
MTISRTAALVPAPEAKPKKEEGAAKQFEALLIAQMLRSAREAASDEDSTASTMIEAGEQQFSQLLANSGGLGLAKLVVKGLQTSDR